jgi:hypothetical protein
MYHNSPLLANLAAVFYTGFYNSLGTQGTAFILLNAE